MRKELAVRLAKEREPVRSDRRPVSIGVSLQPAIPRRVAPQQRPLPLHQPPTILADARSRAKLNASRMQPRPPSPMPCPFQLLFGTPGFGSDARSRWPLLPEGVSSLLCTPGDISILR
jgi:hypothetical protein